MLISLFFLVSLFRNHRRKWNTATHDGIVPLPWKQSRFYLWTFFCLCRRDQGLITTCLGYLRFMVFKLKVINQKSVSLCSSYPTYEAFYFSFKNIIASSAKLILRKICWGTVDTVFAVMPVILADIFAS